MARYRPPSRKRSFTWVAISSRSPSPAARRSRPRHWSNRVFQVKDQAGRQVIDASRLWLSLHDGYGIQIAPGFEVPLGLAICVALERVEAQEQGNESPVRNLLGGIGPF